MVTVAEVKEYLRIPYDDEDVFVQSIIEAGYDYLQDAVDAAPDGKRTTILLGPGKWTKPVVPKGKKIAIKKREGAEF